MHLAASYRGYLSDAAMPLYVGAEYGTMLAGDSALLANVTVVVMRTKLQKVECTMLRHREIFSPAQPAMHIIKIAVRS